uniref:Major sperm protein n=1 Tax=Caenorhabditis japonica TaxID=281687 RepID=A0A8R1I8L2_CAEJA
MADKSKLSEEKKSHRKTDAVKDEKAKKQEMDFFTSTEMKLGLEFDDFVGDEMKELIVDDESYVDCEEQDFPLLIDTQCVYFGGRIGSEPIYSYFTIANPLKAVVQYKVKACSNDNYWIKNPVGTIGKQESVRIVVKAYPVRPAPKTYSDYFSVYAMLGFGTNLKSAWKHVCRDRPLKKRVFIAFQPQPHINRCYALENGRFLVNKQKHPETLKIVDETNRIRQTGDDAVFSIMKEDRLKEEVEKLPDLHKRMTKLEQINNNPTYVRELLKTKCKVENAERVLKPKLEKCAVTMEKLKKQFLAEEAAALNLPDKDGSLKDPNPADFYDPYEQKTKQEKEERYRKKIEEVGKKRNAKHEAIFNDDLDPEERDRLFK